MYRKMKLMTLAAVLCLATWPAIAHHGWSIYQEGFTLTGVIRDINFIYPHDSVVLEDADGNQWKVLFAPPERNRSIDFDKDSLQVGWEVTLKGQRHANATIFEMKTEIIERNGEVIYEYPHPGRRR